MKKVLLLGSGGLQVGQAGEFDYSGSQAIKAAKEEGVRVILINPNIATMQTDKGLADRIYLLPVTPYFVEKVIEREKPDSILLSFGGQTALNCGLALDKSGVLKRNKVQVLGTPVKSIEQTEDRDLFVKKLAEINVECPKSIAVTSVRAALAAAKQIGYPVMVRAAFALGGLGSGIAENKKELEDIAVEAFSQTSQILIEESLYGWKEIEYEVVRDASDNCITVCNMENIDPLGIHTGESIVIAPSQTLTNEEYHSLREIAIKTVRHLGIVGECNIQYALSPTDTRYRVIEVNARLSRSSALASKATGYPLAYIAAKICFGHELPTLRNEVTRITKACFEPALDYVVVKMPRWDLKKLRNASMHIGSSMKSVGEVMAIGRTFEEAFQKATRMIDTGMVGVVGNEHQSVDIEHALKFPTDMRLFAVVEALKGAMPIERLKALTGIDSWFLSKIQKLIHTEEELGPKKKLTKELLARAKREGFSDAQIARIRGESAESIMKLRHKMGIFPQVRQIDTLAAEYPAKTNYLYLTYDGQGHDVQFSKEKKVIVLGSGVYRIGSSVEFDWCCVNAARTFQQRGFKTVMINYNPETVSTDYDECDRLYFEELSFETVFEIYRLEKPRGVLLSTGGQIPNSMATRCERFGLKVFGTQPKDIDRAEDRFKFSRLLDEHGIDQPQWKELRSIEDAVKFARSVSYPVLVRPSYVLSGAAMDVAFDDNELRTKLKAAASVSAEHPVVVSKFITHAKEMEVDGVAMRGKLLAYAITEHVENAGVHSGDATVVMPAQKVYVETMRRIVDITQKIAQALEITGPFNIQFLAKRNGIKVIECNLRASRSFPFVSKVANTNLMEIAVDAMLGKVSPKAKGLMDVSHVGVKVPQFSFARFKGADPVLRVEMSSTGEVATLGRDVQETILKSMMASGFALPSKDVLVSIGGEARRFSFLEMARALVRKGYKLWATQSTHAFLSENGIAAQRVYKISDKSEPNVKSLIMQRKIDLLINVQHDKVSEEAREDLYVMRRLAVDFGIPLITNLELAKLFVESLVRKKVEELEVKAWDEY